MKDYLNKDRYLSSSASSVRVFLNTFAPPSHSKYYKYFLKFTYVFLSILWCLNLVYPSSSYSHTFVEKSSLSTFFLISSKFKFSFSPSSASTTTLSLLSSFSSLSTRTSRSRHCSNFNLEQTSNIKSSNILDNENSEMQTTSSVPNIESSSSKPFATILGLGANALDIIAYVDKYPNPDDKIRTNQLIYTSGGNAGNTLTCTSRLNILSKLITKIGNDGNGQICLSECEKEGLDISHVIVKKGMASPFTYIISDNEFGTRTCIHTPAEEEVLEEEINDSMLEGIDLLHLDSRHTKAAIKLATLAKRKGNIPIVLDAEKPRPYFDQLFPLCDVLVTNNRFPMLYSGIENQDEAMLALFNRGDAKLIITTCGAEGSILMVRKSYLLKVSYNFPSPTLPISFELPSISSSSSSSLFSSSSVEGNESDSSDIIYKIHCNSWPDLSSKEIVDSIGAGDSFIGGIIFSLIKKLPLDVMLQVGTWVATEKLKSSGARSGLPFYEDLISKFYFFSEEKTKIFPKCSFVAEYKI